MYRPEIPIRVRGAAGEVVVSALVDTGADKTIFPWSVAQVVGVDLSKNTSGIATGLGGKELPVALGAVELEVQLSKRIYRWQTEVGFVDFAQSEQEVAVLGHEGFLEHFVATFHGKKRQLDLKFIRG